MVSSWITNNISCEYEYTLPKQISLWIFFAISLFVIIHGAFIHKRVWNRIRIYTDVVSIISILSILLCHLAGLYDKNLIISVMVNFFVYGLFGGAIQIIDNIFVFTIYQATVKIPLWLKYCVYLYIGIDFFLYLVFVLILPFFFDVNSPNVQWWYTVLAQYTLTVMYVTYNGYFGWRIWFSITKKYSNSEMMTRVRQSRASSVLMLSYRNILHLILRYSKI